jgi:nitrogen fixation NifU-like protein
MSLVEDLYREIVLDHYKRPRNFGGLAGATIAVEGDNPSCGDKVRLMLKVDNGAICDAHFSGHGCAISTASASMMTEALKGKTKAEALALAAQFKAMIVDGAEPAPELGHLQALAGVHRLHARVKCATLAWNALEEALKPEAQMQ